MSFLSGPGVVSFADLIKIATIFHSTNLYKLKKNLKYLENMYQKQSISVFLTQQFLLIFDEEMLMLSRT